MGQLVSHERKKAFHEVSKCSDDERSYEDKSSSEPSSGSAETTPGTPSDATTSLIQKKMKALALDPRSPSGIPRTPILVESSPSERNSSTPMAKEVKVTRRTMKDFVLPEEVDQISPVKLNFTTNKAGEDKEASDLKENDGEDQKLVQKLSEKESGEGNRNPLESVDPNSSMVL